jgi:hypothetical protein
MPSYGTVAGDPRKGTYLWKGWPVDEARVWPLMETWKQVSLQCNREQS